MIVKTHDENWESLFRSCLNESLAHHTGTRTTTYPNLSIVTSSIFGGDGLVPVAILTIIKFLLIHTPYIRIITMKNRYIWIQSILFSILCIWSSDIQQIWVSIPIDTTRELKQPSSCWQLLMFTLYEGSNLILVSHKKKT